MRFMMIVKPPAYTGVPDPAQFEAMGRYNDELQRAGVLLDLNGLAPTAQGVRVQFSGTQRTVVDGPFAESKELIGGYWIIRSIEGRGRRVGQADPVLDRGAPRRARRGRDPADHGARGSAGEPRASGREEGPRAAQALSDAAAVQVIESLEAQAGVGAGRQTEAGESPGSISSPGTLTGPSGSRRPFQRK